LKPWSCHRNKTATSVIRRLICDRCPSADVRQIKISKPADHMAGGRHGPAAERRPGWHDGPVQQGIFRPARYAHAWVDELPAWSVLSPVGHVDGSWQWRGVAAGSAVKRAAAWGYRAQRGATGEYGVLGARFEPHEYPYLRVFVAATLEADGLRAPDRFGEARVGLPLDHLTGIIRTRLCRPTAPMVSNYLSSGTAARWVPDLHYQGARSAHLRARLWRLINN
jgi:hypothetical protein